MLETIIVWGWVVWYVDVDGRVMGVCGCVEGVGRCSWCGYVGVCGCV